MVGSIVSGEGGKIASYRWLLGLSRESEFMSCVKVEVDVLGFSS